jgi:hypothetical protein
MALAASLGSAMGLNFAATFMFACVVFVAVSFWVDARIARRRRSTQALDSPADPEQAKHE